MYLWRSGKDAPAQRFAPLEIAGYSNHRQYPISRASASSHSALVTVIASPLCGFATRLAVMRPFTHPTQAPDSKENIVASHQSESLCAVDFAPHRIAADTKIVRQREMRHFDASARYSNCVT
jgi:hypothetical protein